MNRSRLRKSLTAFVALAGLGGLALSLVDVAELKLHACFDDAGGLDAGAPVMLRGVRVGRVESVVLDADYRACVILGLSGNLALADDTSASIFTQNVLGDRYVALQPGGSERRLRSGEKITYTQSALPLERMIGRYLLQLDDPGS